MKKALRNKGYTLVEVLVAAAVIAFSLIAVVAVVRKGQDMVAIEKHRAMARGIVEQQLEKPPYQPEYYNSLVTKTPTSPDTVVIDPGTGLKGWLTVTVGDSITTVNGVAAPYRPITARVYWNEPGSATDTVTVTKWLADVQRN